MTKRIEERRNQAQRMEALGRVARVIAHDFNNVLAAILGTADLLAIRLDKSEAQKDAVDIREAAERGVALTRQLLAFGRQARRPDVLDVRRIGAREAASLRRRAGRRVRVHMHLGKAPARVRAEPGQLELVLANLVDNAREAMPRGGTIDIEIGAIALREETVDSPWGLPPGRYVRVGVRDTGGGIDPEAQPRVFDPFFTTKDPATSGGGLGLTIVSSLVRDAGGMITFSTKPKVGTTFEILLPAAGKRRS